MGLRFHWRMLMGGEEPVVTRSTMNSREETGLPDLDAQIQFCRTADECGIDSLLTDFGFSKPDPILLAAALGLATERIKFIVAYRSGLLCPTTFVQQLNTLSTLINGRFSLNIVAGNSPEEQRYYGDYLSHDERYSRTEELLSICRALWKRDGPVTFAGQYYKLEGARLNTPFISSDRSYPEIFIGGSSAPAQRLAVSYGDCWMMMADTPERIRARIAPALAAGIEVGLRAAVVAAPTHDAAVNVAHSLVAGLDRDGEKERQYVSRSDSVSLKAVHGLEAEWPTRYLWTGAVRFIGGAAIALVGSPDEVASAIMEYRDVGITQFIFSGWPKLDAMKYFGKEILPLIRIKEQNAARGSSGH
jgi:alkanesulfonate monooxygenase